MRKKSQKKFGGLDIAKYVCGTKSNKMIGKVYLLRNPLDDSVFYVGQTIYKLHERLAGHLHDKAKGNKTKIISEILENKLMPSIEELESMEYNHDNVKQLNEREVFWIKHYNPIGNKMHVEVFVKECRICNKMFEAKRERSIYCSSICRATASQNRQKSLEKKPNDSIVFKKRDKCLYCESDLDSKYRSKRFCQPKCRVYWNRENKKAQFKPDVLPQKELSQKPEKELTKLELFKLMKNQYGK